jgi:hypothetical protein
VTAIAMASNVWTANRYATFKSNVLTIKAGSNFVDTRACFKRPLDMTIDMRQVSGSPECGVVAMFPSSKTRHSGYNAGLGWWANRFGYGTPGAKAAVIHVHRNNWKTVRIYAAGDGNVYFFLNGALERVVKDTQLWGGAIRVGNNCRDYQYRNLIVKS